MSTPLIEPALVRLDADLGGDKNAVIGSLAQLVADAGRSDNPGGLTDDALARVATSATGLPGGIAIPHCRTAHVAVPTLAFARLSPPVDFGAKDGAADLAFLIAAPAGGDATHLQLLTKLARALVKKDFTDSLRSAGSADEIVRLVTDVVGEAPAPSAAPAAPAAAAAATTQAPAPAAAAPAPAATATQTRRLVAITACPTGIAHTYMAAESLEAAAQRAGVEISVETQGSAGSTPLPSDTIAAADAVIFATDVGVKDRGRFAGKPMVASGVKRAIDDSDGMIREALANATDPGAPRVEGSGAGAAAGARTGGGEESFGLKVRRVLMTGVSYMIPFVAAGGLMIALGFLLGGYQIALGSQFDGSPVATANHILTNSTLFNLPDPSAYQIAGTSLPHGALLTYLGALMFAIGAGAFSFLVPALAGYIAYGIADRPGIAPGFIMGWVATNILNSGFLGGIIGGLLAGVVAHWLAQRSTPAWLRGLMPVVVIPLVTTVVCGFIMVVVLGKPLNSLMTARTDGLTNLSQGSSAVLLGVVLGLMMAFDMGGPLNKTAYLFATAGLGAAATATGDAPQLKIMAAVMIAGMVPPLALALATVVRPQLFTEPERENGKAAWLLGASFITEGAIPFAAADPLRVVPSIMAGSAVAGGLSMALDVTLRAPHGGIFVLFAVGHTFGFFIALIAGTLVAAALVIGLKQFTESKEEIEELALVA
jgi:PTS system fructose-specific IIC component